MSEIILEFPDTPQFEFLTDWQGESLYQKWLGLGNVGDYAAFLEWLKIKGDPGYLGWSPLLVIDGTTIAGKTLFKLSDWTGGEGVKPTLNVGKWLKSDGTFTAVSGEAHDLTGVQGIPGVDFVTTTIENVSLLVANWTLVSGMYEYNYANALILATSVVNIIPYESSTNTILQAEIEPMVVSAVGTLKIKAKYLPKANILIAINLNR